MNKQEYRKEMAAIGEALKSDLHGEDLAVVDVYGISNTTAEMLISGCFKTGKAMVAYLEEEGVENIKYRIASDIRGAIRRA